MSAGAPGPPRVPAAGAVGLPAIRSDQLKAGDAYWQSRCAGQPVLNRTPYEGPLEDFVTMESLQLPLAGDGNTVDMILVFVAFMRGVARR